MGIGFPLKLKLCGYIEDGVKLAFKLFCKNVNITSGWWIG